MLQFKPALIPTVSMVMLVVFFSALGFWQLDRAQQKRSAANQLDIRSSLPPLVIGQELIPSDQIEYRPLKVTGQLIEKKQIFIENRKHQGKNGFHVITPLAVNSSNRHLLINRGWVASKDEATSQPSSGSITTTGHAVTPQPPAIQLSDTIPTADQNTWPYFTAKLYSAWSGLKVYPFILLQDPGQSDGFVRKWPKPKAGGSEMHVGYAIQWFAFGIIALAIWAKLSILRSPAEGEQS